MSPKSKREYFKTIARRYQKASRNNKSRILEEFCQVCHYHRKYAIAKLNAYKTIHRIPPSRQKPGLAGLNPFKLKRTIDEKIAKIYQLAR